MSNFLIIPGHFDILCANSSGVQTMEFYCKADYSLNYRVSQIICIFRKIKIGDFWQFIFALWSNQISYSKFTTIWRKLKFSAFSRWLWIFCCTFGLHVAIKTISPRVANFLFLQIFTDFCNFVLIKNHRI